MLLAYKSLSLLIALRQVGTVLSEISNKSWQGSHYASVVSTSDCRILLIWVKFTAPTLWDAFYHSKIFDRSFWGDNVAFSFGVARHFFRIVCVQHPLRLICLGWFSAVSAFRFWLVTDEIDLNAFIDPLISISCPLYLLGFGCNTNSPQFAWSSGFPFSALFH